MREIVHTLLYMARQDPLAVLGLVLCGAYGVLFFHLELQLRRNGYNTKFGHAESMWWLPKEYLKLGGKHGWSRWPAYLLWPCLLFGILFLVIGLFRLQQ